MKFAASHFVIVASIALTCLQAQQVRSASDDALSGGDTTVFDNTRNAFSLTARNLREDHRPSFFVGNSFFNLNWVVAPASVRGRDGLGPLFNARSCSGCHFKDGRGRPPEAGEPIETMLLRISIPGTDEHGGPRPDPVYGDQLQTDAVPGVAREADVFVAYEEIAGAFADGEPYALRRPSYEIRNPGYGPLSPSLLVSPRVSPAIVGMGLLEAIPEETLRRLSDPEDRDGDGVSGRINMVWNQTSGRLDVGRFGWKAEQPSVAQQAAAAFNGDLGITSAMFPLENHTAAETAKGRLANERSPEVDDKAFAAVVLYARTLAVPAARSGEDARAVRGRAVFSAAGCQACHVPALRTGRVTDLPELADQTIHPYTDLLVHDMGEALADNRPTFGASGREWRTPPLWGLGLVSKVNGHTCFLHDGRARNAAEAILWHGGEGAAARDRFRAMPKPERTALLAFLNSL
ncbi:MAG TPA: di-heme oxidoredictase family protein [Vicinamibacterales bacterium]|nr:di-heme oxidoredictase family protein [Vicinamibacterales bacterium]